jgi:ribokinase
VIVTLGDLLLDVIVRLEQPLAEGADANAVTRLGPGGQAANVAAWVAHLGGRARFVGKFATDEAGATAARALERYGVELRGPVVHGRTGTVVSLVAADGSRTMASDRGVSPELRAEELDPAWFEGCEHLHLPGYSLLRSPVDEAALRAAELAPRVSVDLSSWSAIRDFGRERFRARLEEIRADVVFANEDEERMLDGPLSGCTWVLKLGSRGARFGYVELPALTAQVVDTTGAGDALAAGYLVGGPELALEAAARCVAKLGSMP